GGHDRAVERDADRPHRDVDELAVGAGEDAETPASAPRLLERRRNLREDLPRRERAPEHVAIVPRRAEPLQRRGHHLAVRTRRVLRLHLRLDLVVAVELLVRPILAEDPRELAPDAPVPVDQRPVAVERGPALAHAGTL